MYEQEKFLWMSGYSCTLPDSGAIVDMDYDPMQDKLKVVSASNESSWTGLVRTMTSPVSAGSFSKASHRSGVKLLARSTTNPGVDVTIPAYGLREELVNRAERAAALARNVEPFDWLGGFTANTNINTTTLTSIASVTYPSQTTVNGAVISGTGIPASSTLTLVGTTGYLSVNATATGTGVSISFTDFILPVGYIAKEVIVNGVGKQEGTTKDWTRVFDGFREIIRFGTAPGATAWVQVLARRT
jgi:hypothetical protein